MTASKPYLIRALYEWMTDNGLTPYLFVKVNTPNCMVPQEFAKNGEIVLDISMEATQGLNLGNDAIEFKARFSGKVRELYIPIHSVAAIYSQENGQGMAFPEQEDVNDEPLKDNTGGGPDDDSSDVSGKPPHLKLVD